LYKKEVLPSFVQAEVAAKAHALVRGHRYIRYLNINTIDFIFRVLICLFLVRMVQNPAGLGIGNVDAPPIEPSVLLLRTVNGHGEINPVGMRVPPVLITDFLVH
jgi:hypothetical protein